MVIRCCYLIKKTSSFKVMLYFTKYLECNFLDSNKFSEREHLFSDDNFKQKHVVYFTLCTFTLKQTGLKLNTIREDHIREITSQMFTVELANKRK